MRRLLLAAWAFALAPLAATAGDATPAELRATAQATAALQNDDGGFAATPGGPSSLGATSSAVRILKYTGGSIPDVLACIRYVESCLAPEGYGYAPTPGGTPDPRTTAVGVMVASELKLDRDKYLSPPLGYLDDMAVSYEDVRLAAAAFEAAGPGTVGPKFDDWAKVLGADRKADGTWGEGAGRAFATGGTAAGLLRLGLEIDQRDAVIAVLREGQRDDGGWSSKEGPSDLASSYRIVRALFMLDAAPDLSKLRDFVARCRQEDGRYKSSPDGPVDGAGTYFATIILRWARQLEGQPPLIETAGFKPLFNGQDLAGWEGNADLWSARDGMLVGNSPGIDHNEFLVYESPFADFVLAYSFRLVGGAGNSGVQFRSERIPGTEMRGYQADIGEDYWGCLYDESRRNKVLVAASPRALEAVHKDGWNRCVIRAEGGHVTIAINGVTSVDYREDDATIPASGKIGLQIHGGGPMEIQFRDHAIQPLPMITEGGSGPGFVQRTVKVAGGERKYVVYVPRDYDGSKPLPALLFLHGSGERGEDGLRPALVGLGPSLAVAELETPFIAIFPQARESWAAGSADALAAIAALDDAATAYKIDPDRVVVTGLSMGGRGTWDMAAAHPDRFAAAVPICGPARTPTADGWKDIPVWAFVGDADRDGTVLGMRAKVAALREAKVPTRYTEYRGVGHNSWDRAYADPELFAWMLARRRGER